MKSFEAILSQVTDTGKVMQTLCWVLHECDPQYSKVEADFINGIQKLNNTIDHDKQMLLDNIIKAENERVITDLLYLVLLGMNQNILCSRDPYQKTFSTKTTRIFIKNHL